MRAPEGISLSLPGGDFRYQAFAIVDALVEALAAQHADFDLDHVQPTGMLGDVVELQPLQHPARFAGGEGLVECTGCIPQRIALAAPVADFPLDHEPLLIEFNGAAGLAAERIGKAEIPERSALAAPVAHLPRDR